MKRWSALLLLVLLPLTMAPRTSLNGEHLDIDVDTPRLTTKVNQPLPMKITFTNSSDGESKLMPIWIQGVNGAGAVTLRSRSKGCTSAGDTVGCFLPPLEAGESKTIKVRARTDAAGEMAIGFGAEAGNRSLGSVLYEVVER